MLWSYALRRLPALLMLLLVACHGTGDESVAPERNVSRTNHGALKAQSTAPQGEMPATMQQAPANACPVYAGPDSGETSHADSESQSQAYPYPEPCDCSYQCPPPPPCYYLAGCDSYGCFYQQMSNGSWCEDGDSCTSGDSCQWGECTGGQNVCQQPELSIQAGSNTLEMLQGETRNLTTLIHVTHESGGYIHIVNEVLISPQGGLGLSSDYPPEGYYTSGSVSFVMNQSFAGLAPGTYSVTNRARVEGTSIVASHSFTVHVLPAGGNPVLLPLGSFPDGVPAYTSSEVTFTATASDFLVPPEYVLLRQGEGPNAPSLAYMNDQGVGGDLLAGDGVYSAKVWISSSGPGTQRYQASAKFPGIAEERFSAAYNLVVSCLPTTVQPSQPGSIVYDSGGTPLLCNEVLVSFAPEVTCQQKAQIIAERVGGVIVGTQPGLGLHQVRLSGACTASGVEQAIQALRADWRIQQASANYVGVADSVAPNDPLFGSQTGLTKIRADEAWVLARGAALIAVVDTGVDYNHPDLAGQVLKGKDFVANDDDPLDEVGHGTIVASVIGANSNNAQGMAGVAWNSKLLAVRAIDGESATSISLASAAIKYAADQGAKVINCSFGMWEQINRPVDTSKLKEAVKYATEKGAIVVASAGNRNNDQRRFPCAYEETLCVAGTDNSDGRLVNSSYGPHVDISAPGEHVIGALRNGVGYTTATGTSFSAAHVSGSLSVLWSYLPSWTPEQIRERLLTTAAPLANPHLGRGRVDLFEAVFNGSFEDGINGWTTAGTAGSVEALGPFLPQDRLRMGFLSSGPDAEQIQTTIDQDFTVQPGVTSIPLRFDYNFVTEEYPEWVGTAYNDNMRIILVGPDGGEMLLAYEEINSSFFSPVSGIDFPGGDTTVGATGWKTVSATIPVSSGPGRYSIRVRDEGDGIYDSNLLIDNIRFK